MILRARNYAAQTALNRFYAEIANTASLITSSAYNQARKKLKMDLFIALSEQLKQEFYDGDPDDPGLLWCGHRLLGFDPTVINVPETEETRAAYSVQVHQHGDQVQAHSGVLYDVLNQITLSASLGKRRSGKEMLLEHSAELRENDVVVCDREFGDYGLLAWLSGHNRQYIVRLQRNSFAAAQSFMSSEATDAIVEIPCTSKQRAFVSEHGLAESLQVRLVKIALPSGEPEILATSLYDGDVYSVESLSEAYRLRWEIETYFDRLKNIFEIERFSGQSVAFIEQDFYGTLFLSSLESLLIAPGQAELTDKSQTTRYAKQVNRKVSYSALIEHAVAILLSPEDQTQTTIERLTALFQQKPTSRRPNRQYRRKKSTKSSQNHHLRYKRRPSA
jgi:hypothetical protein